MTPSSISPEKPEFRTATADDVAAVVALVESAYRGDAAREGWTTEADLIGGQRTDEDSVAEALTQPEITILMAEIDGNLMGCAQLTRRLQVVEFGMFAVRPWAQGRGLGGAVLAEAEAMVRRRSAPAAPAAESGPDIGSGPGIGSGRDIGSGPGIGSGRDIGSGPDIESGPVMEMLVIRQRLELIAWYARRGYLPTGERRPFPYGNSRYGLPFLDDLEFVVLAKTLLP